MAGKIKYVCLSDLHLGEEDSLLTFVDKTTGKVDTSQASEVMKQLAECLKTLVGDYNGGEKPVLVLNGDILELALAYLNESAMVFERFVETIMPEGGELFERIIYVPGNHDHHIWEIARETQFANYLKSKEIGQGFKRPWHSTYLFRNDLSEYPPAYILNRLLMRSPHLKTAMDAGTFGVNAAYPNFGVMSEDRQKCVVFHHGHYIDNLYMLMTTLKTLVFGEKREMPEEIWEIEAENFAWIDFFWSTLGRSGDVGESVEMIYEKMHYAPAFKKVLSGLGKNIADNYDIPLVPGDYLEKKVITGLLHFAHDRIRDTERNRPEKPMSSKGEIGLRSYVTGPLQMQIKKENNSEIPPEVTCVIGHTHKPHQYDYPYAGYSKPVNFYNTGGWVVGLESERHKGASIVLVDDAFDATSIRVFNETEDGTATRVRVVEARRLVEEHNPFHKQIADFVDADQAPWTTFSDFVAKGIRIRRAHLFGRVKS
jgi:UDP-2,3-diacylglucosamine pyrophosphatase LpxH